jgi:hypothetical protein
MNLSANIIFAPIKFGHLSRQLCSPLLRVAITAFMVLAKGFA